MSATAQLSAAAITVFCFLATGCGTGGSTRPYNTTLPIGGSSGQTEMSITCTPVSGQRVTSPFFVGQNLQCAALSGGSPATVRWSTSAGVINHYGLITNVTDPVVLTVSAESRSSRSDNISTQNLTVSFAKPVGAPGLIFSVPVATGSVLWDLAVDELDQISGGGWSSASTPNAELFSMDFWSRAPQSTEISRSSMLTAAALIATQPFFGGGTMDSSSYRPLLVSSDQTSSLVTIEECSNSGMLTALTFDNARGSAWGAWSGDSGAARIRIDQQSRRLQCSSATQLLTSTSAQTKVPWVWSIHATSAGTIAAGHYISGNDTVGFVKMNDDDGNEIGSQEFPGLADVRVTPAVYENGIATFYLAGHDISNSEDVWTVKKLDANLQPLFTRQWNLLQGKTEPLSIIPDATRGVILGGKATQLAPAGGDTNLTDAILMSLDDSGNTKWGPIRINPSNTGADACLISSIRLTPDSKFLVAAVICGQSTMNSYLLGFALP